MKSSLLAVALSFCAAPLWAVEYFVDAENGNDAWDGTSATFVSDLKGPKKTIRAAVELANDPDRTEKAVVTVAPGTYGGDASDYVEWTDTSGNASNVNVGRSRVVITKSNLVLRSSGGRDKTVIRGYQPTGGIGAGAIRGIWIANQATSSSDNAKDIVIEGFTFADGATASSSSANGWGGGVGASWPDAGGAALVIDCAFINCLANRGGGVMRCHAYRSLFTRCYGSGSGSAQAFGKCQSCIFIGNRGSSVLANLSNCTDCSILYNEGTAVANGYGGYVSNCLVAGNDNNGGSGSSVKFRYSVCAAPYSNGGSSCETTGTVTDADPELIASPLTEDWRLPEGHAAWTQGNYYYISEQGLKLPDGYAYADYYGTPYTAGKSGDHVTCGAVVGQGTYVRDTTYGKIAFTGYMTLKGHDYFTYKGYLYPQTAEAVAFHGPGQPYCYQWNVPAVNNLTEMYATDFNDGWARVMPPMAQEGVRTVSIIAAAGTLYVDATTGSDDYDGMSPMVESDTRGPKKTIQAAANAVTANKTLVYVAPGVYDRGETLAHSEDGYVVTNRLTCRYETGFVATGDRDRTVIRGAADPTTGGNGTGAIRCYCPKGVSFLHGITLADGHTDTHDKAPGRGGAVYAMNAASSFLEDCVITNCHAVQGGGVYGGSCYRCRFYGNRSHGGTGGAVAAKAVLVSSVADDANACEAGGTLFSGCSLFGCTICNADVDKSGTTLSCSLYGCAIEQNKTADYGSENVMAPDMLFADADGHDYRLGRLSPAVKAVSVETYLEHADRWTGDIGLKPLRVAGGKFNAGAFQDAELAMFTVECPEPDAVTVTGAKIGLNIIDAARTVTISAKEGRPFGGVVVGGVTNYVLSHTFEAVPDVENLPVYSVAGSAGCWYVDGTNGNDENGGGTLEWPKRTISHVTAQARGGDVVLVERGTYGEQEGSYLHTVPCDPDTGASPITVPSRVRVPADVKVKSLRGARETVIVGAESNLRCVYLGGVGAEIDGFTLTGGRVGTASAGHDDNIAGAVISLATSGIARNCVISNNVGGRVGAVYHCSAINCLIVGNTGLQRQSVGREASFSRCVIADNHSAEPAIQYPYGRIDCCTFGRNWNLAGTALVRAVDMPGGSISMYNTLTLSPVALGTEGRALNCAFVEGQAMPSEALRTDCVVVAADKLQLDADYAPVVGSNEAVDRGNEAILPESLKDGVDFCGNERVRNATMDIGAIEGDWRVRYARDLSGNRKIAVLVADGRKVVETEDRRVRMMGGAFVYTVPYSGYTQRFAVDGAGTLTLYVNGEKAGDFVRSDDEQSVRIDFAGDEPAEVRWAYAAADTDAGGVTFGRLTSNRGGLLMLR